MGLDVMVNVPLVVKADVGLAVRKDVVEHVRNPARAHVGDVRHYVKDLVNPLVRLLVIVGVMGIVKQDVEIVINLVPLTVIIPVKMYVIVHVMIDVLVVVKRVV